MTDLHDAALRAGVFQVIEREAKAAKDAARAQIMAGLPVGDAVSGKVGDDILCKASWSKGAAKISITDPGALLAWAKEKRPTEVVVTETVNDAYIKTLKPVGKNVVDADGEVVPGIEVATGKPSLSVRSEKNALDLVIGLIEAGRVSLNEIKAIAQAAEEESAPDGEVVDVEVVDVEVIEGEVVEG